MARRFICYRCIAIGLAMIGIAVLVGRVLGT